MEAAAGNITNLEKKAAEVSNIQYVCLPIHA